MATKKIKNKNTKNNNKNKTPLVKKITITKLKELSEKTDGLIIQGCLDDANDLIDYFNNIWTEENILLAGFKFSPEDCFIFENDGIRCICFEICYKPIDTYRLAAWRLWTYNFYNGIWLSDYVENRLNRKEF